MSLLVQTRRIGDITVVTCSGQVVEGAESAALQHQLGDLIPHCRHVLLNLGGVDFIDSSGLGLLIRFLARSAATHGHFSFCAAQPRIVEMLRMSKLASIFESYDSEADAVAACGHAPATTDAPYQFRTDVLCVEKSEDVRHYLREILAQAGYGVITTGSLPDALVLLRTMLPKAVVISAELQASRSTPITDAFRMMAGASAVVELPPHFPRDDAGVAARRLVDQVRAIVGKSARPPTT